MKTNAMRILDSLSIPYSVHTYQWDEEHLDAVHAAESAGLDPERVYKTIVMRNSGKRIFVFCLPAEFGISLKKARALTASREIDLIRMDELLPLTGYIRGGCSPVGMKKAFPTYFDESCGQFDYIYVSAGVRGLQFKINPADLVKYVRAQLADLTVVND